MKFSYYYKFFGIKFSILKIIHYYEFIEGVENLIKYFKVIWNDRNFDYNYIFILLLFKIQDQRKAFEKRDTHVSSKRNAKEMLICEYLLKRIIKDEYKTFRKTYRTGDFKYQEYMKKQDINYLFKYIEKHYEGWWD